MGDMEAGEVRRAAQVHLAHHLLLLGSAASGFHRGRRSALGRLSTSSSSVREKPRSDAGGLKSWAIQVWAMFLHGPSCGLSLSALVCVRWAGHPSLDRPPSHLCANYSTKYRSGLNGSSRR